MLFDDVYNHILKCLCSFDEEFEKDYKEFVKSLPLGIGAKCRKMMPFRVDRGNKTYRLTGTPNKDVELTIEDEYSIRETLMLFVLCRKELEDMEKFENTKGPRSMKDTSVLDLGWFERINSDGKKVSYSFLINRRKDGYYLIRNKVIDGDDIIYGLSGETDMNFFALKASPKR